MLPCQNTNILPRTVSMFWLALIVTLGIRLKERDGARKRNFWLLVKARQ